jgi:hypothetical protein
MIIPMQSSAFPIRLRVGVCRIGVVEGRRLSRFVSSGQHRSFRADPPKPVDDMVRPCAADVASDLLPRTPVSVNEGADGRHRPHRLLARRRVTRLAGGGHDDDSSGTVTRPDGKVTHRLHPWHAGDPLARWLRELGSPETGSAAR